MYTWERYLFRDVLKTFLFILVLFFLFYAVIDYSLHMKDFARAELSPLQILSYYSEHFSKRAQLLLPLALLLAFVRSLYHLNHSNELVSLLSAGYTLKLILRPYLFLSFLVTVFLFYNFEKALPKSMERLNHFEENVLNKSRSSQQKKLNKIPLEDGTELIYQTYRSSKKAFYDVIWMLSAEEIYRMEYLYPFEIEPLAKGVEHYQRVNGAVVLQDYAERQSFPEILFPEETLNATIVLPEDQSISRLWEHLPRLETLLSDKETEILTAFFYKLTLPFLAVFVLLLPAPYCLRFGRNRSIFPIVAFGVCGYMTYFTVLRAATTLSDNQLVSPVYTLGIPFAILTLLSCRNYLALR